MKIWKATYEENWGTRWPRQYHSVFFQRTPTFSEAIQKLEEKFPHLKERGGLQPQWFTYGPLKLVPVELIENGE